MADNRITCCKCGKVIGEKVYDGGMNSPLGYIPMYHEKMDYRKAAHVFMKKGGHICKGCAIKFFPERKTYTVNFKYHGKEMSLPGNSEAHDRFATKAEADAARDRMNDMRNGSFYEVIEHKL